MASETNVKINLKTVAQTGDAEKLVAIIKALGKSLKEAGGEDAKELRGNLAPMLKELAKGGVSADRVKGMAGQVAKVQALGSISALNAKLSQFGTAQARIIQRTVADIKAAVEGGDLSGNTIDALNESLERFVAEANKLPPAGLKKLGNDIQQTVSYTQELQDVIASISGIDFKVSGGSGSLDELAHKMQVISEAQDLDAGVKELEAAVQDLDPENAATLTKELEKIREILNGDLDAKGAEELNAALERVSRTASRLGGQDLGKVSSALNRVTSGGRALSQSMGEMSERGKAGLGLVESLLGEIGIRVDSVVEKFVAFGQQIPGVGKAFKALGGVGTLVLAAIIWSATKIVSTLREWKRFKLDQEFNAMGEAVKRAHRDTEVYFSLLDQTMTKEKEIVDVKREQVDAANALVKAQMELNKAKELEGVEDSATRTMIEEKYGRIASGLEDKEGRIGYARKVEDEDEKIRRLEAELAKYEEDYKTDQEAGNLYMRKSRYFLKEGTGGAGNFLFSGFGYGSMEREKAKEYGESANEYLRSASDNQLKIQETRAKLEAARARRAALTAKVEGGEKSPEEARLDAEKAKRESEARDREAAERRRVEGIRRQRERDEAIFGRDAADTEREHRRSVAEPYQDIATHLKTAEEELKRFSALEEDAARRRERVMRDFARSGRAEMTAEEQFAFDSANSDLSYARQHRYQEQGNVASLKKQIRDRDIDKGFSDYDERREDSEWRRQGRYSRANYAQRLKMDEERYEEGVRQFEAAEARIRAANAGTRALTPEERRLAERERAEGRRKMTESRESIRSALYEGDSQKAGFVSGLMRNGNRLTQMGLGGDVANWDRKTADNTRRLVQQTKEILTAMNARGKYGNLGAVWGM